MRQLKEPSLRSSSLHAFQHFAPNSDHLACWLVRLVIPQHCSTRAELVITHTMASRLTVIKSRLSAWICQPFCCQRTLLFRVHRNALNASELVWWDLLTEGSVLPSSTASSHPKESPENKKPGVERRAQSLFPSDSARSSTSSSPCCS